MIPKRSLHGILQEDLWPNQWAILVTCLLLNKTTRKQVETVLGDFFSKWPTPEALIASNPAAIAEVISKLGFKNRRTSLLLKMSERFLMKDWSDASELPGIGAYAASCWRMLCRRQFASEPPDDHALVDYWVSCHGG